MRIIFQKRSYVVLALLIAILVVFVLIDNSVKSKKQDVATAIVERGEVNEMVSVSGFVEAKNTANLAFPTTGIVTEVFVDEGAEVKTGEVLATLASGKLIADRNEAMATLGLAQAQLDETTAGPTTETRTVAETKVSNAETNLAQVTIENEEKVSSALRALLSNDLEARSTDPQESATPPTITGTYGCTEEGSYNMSVYSSGAPSGYSYKLTGLSNSFQSVFTDQPALLDSCGLYIQFAGSGLYSNSNWVIDVPNKNSSTYVTKKNAYDLAVKQQTNAISAAEDALNLALKETDLTLAEARTEVVDQKRAGVSQAWARVAQIDALLADRSIVAPFAGIVTNVDIITGETAGASPVVTVLAEDAFELTARIPEIDIRKINNGQAVKIEFDAAAEEVIDGHVSYVSPLATEIDGVAYFEATITLDETPDWMRSGLNADIDIIIGESNNTLRLPKHFISKENGKNFVLIGEKKKEIEILFTGNDGYVAISGLNEGDEVIAP